MACDGMILSRACRGVQASLLGRAGFAGQQPPRPSLHVGRSSGALSGCLRAGREGSESLQLTKISTAAVAASGPSLGSRPPQRDGLGCAPGVIQHVSVSVSKEDSRAQMPTVECEFLRQPTADSG
jgi:hypothetical protein